MNSRSRLARLSYDRSARTMRNRRDFSLQVDGLESRQLLTGGILKIRIEELETGQFVEIMDEGPGDARLGTIGTVQYAPGVSPFTDFNISSIQVVSNRTATSSLATLTQSGTVTRSTSSEGARTLLISAMDSDYTHPTEARTLTSSATATFTHPTSLDTVSFESFADTVSSGVITLAPNLAADPSSKSGNSGAVPVAITAPFSLSNVYTVKLGPSSAAGTRTVSYQDTGTTTVSGNNPQKIAGTVFSDLNHDNLLNQVGEAGIGGVTMTLTGRDTKGLTVSLSTVTNPDGTYEFNVTNPSTAAGYTITQSPVLGYFHEGEIAGTTGALLISPRTIKLPASLGDSLNNNFSEEPVATVSGFVYVDSDNNGVLAGTEGSVGFAVPVILTGTDVLGGAVSVSGFADALTGFYSFSGLRAGSYTVTETAQPASYFDGLETQGNVASLPGSNLTDAIDAITVGYGEVASNNNFGEVVPVSLSGVVYVDTDKNGTLEAGETARLSGVTITLKDANGAVVTSQPTGTDGSYLFTNLYPGNYTIEEGQPVGYGSSTPNSIAATVPATGLTDQNFGEITGGVGGIVYVDLNNNGVLDGNDTRIEGVSILIEGTDDLGNTVSRTATTDPDGEYYFFELLTGTYRVTQPTQPAGLLDGKESFNAVPYSGSMGTDQIDGIVVTGGERVEDYNFGEIRPALISGFAYIDSDSDGIKDATGVGLKDVVITLSGVDDQGAKVSLQKTTGTDGSYSFGNLRPGTYSVTEGQPAGYTTTKNAVGSVGGTLATPTTDAITAISLGSGASGTSYNFGENSHCRGNTDKPLGPDSTATIGFWQNNNGQALIKSLNGCDTKKLGNWLATSFPYLYGAHAPSGSNLTGKTNNDVAALFLKYFKVSGKKSDAQMLATALAVYVTDSDLAGNAAVKYGFSVSSSGTAVKTYDVGTNGSLIGLSNNQSYSVLAILQAANQQKKVGTFNSTAFNAVFEGINRTGDIS